MWGNENSMKSINKNRWPGPEFEPGLLRPEQQVLTEICLPVDTKRRNPPNLKVNLISNFMNENL